MPLPKEGNFIHSIQPTIIVNGAKLCVVIFFQKHIIKTLIPNNWSWMGLRGLSEWNLHGLFKNRFSSNINSKLYSSFDIKYIHSSIDNYSSDAVAFKFSLYYYNTRFLLQSFIDNYGIIFSPYTNFYEHFPSSYGCKIMVLPQYINSVFSLKYNSFRDYKILFITYYTAINWL